MESMMELPRDINKICRTCMNFTDELITSQNYIVYKDQITELCTMLQNITSLQISTDDNLPVTLCSRCVNHVKIAYSFIRKCEEVDQKIRRLLKHSSHCNNESITESISNSNSILPPNKPINTYKLDNYLTCQMCHKVVVSNYELSIHMITHNNDKNLSEMFTNYRSISDTIAQDVCKPDEFLINEDQMEDVDCVVDCGVTDERSIEPKMGNSSCDDDGKYYECTLCENKFLNSSSLSLHFLKHALASQIPMNDTLSQLLFCEVCGQILNDDSSLAQHYSDQHMHKPTWECPKCVEMFDSEADLLKHNGVTHLLETKFDTNGILQCILCSENFSSHSEIVKHLVTHLSKTFSCNKCPLKFCTQLTYFKHLERHLGNKYKCSICGKCLSSKRSLRCHTEGVHSLTSKHSCDTCGKCFATNNRLKLHLKLHTADKQYICSYCGYSCHRSCDLKVHTRIHTSETPYKCTFSNCSRTFKTSSHLCDHVRGHLNVRLHKCSVCGKTFTAGHVLKKHLLLHSGERPHICIICHKTFKRKDHLYIHMKQHNT